ncbi:hypothetical protein MgSA37_03647 [Mucilaginibacter gotjawali]|uniref:Uncharacterized protein n=1 Tax=Mucilaginibacter gotjawali TaxID=1550579 RepID=A0A0X8X5I4_9SPHI|nr:hypothetical protein [Mucilaginibacter gotjawali]BAU55458.1 hypothetical protein MgSA37_03647 [Mucilaginibacter gotjawali]
MALVVGLWLFNVSVLLNFVAGFYDRTFFAVLGTQLLLMMLFELMLLWPVTKFFRRQRLLQLIVISIPLYVLYFVYIGMIGNKGKYLWKGRMVR